MRTCLYLRLFNVTIERNVCFLWNKCIIKSSNWHMYNIINSGQYHLFHCLHYYFVRFSYIYYTEQHRDCQCVYQLYFKPIYHKNNGNDRLFLDSTVLKPIWKYYVMILVILRNIAFCVKFLFLCKLYKKARN